MATLKEVDADLNNTHNHNHLNHAKPEHHRRTPSKANQNPPTLERRTDKVIRFQHQILCQLALDRKSENYNRLKQWDQERAYQLGVHRKVIEEIIAQVDRKLKNSEQYLQAIYEFLSDKAEQYVRPITSYLESLRMINSKRIQRKYSVAHLSSPVGDSKTEHPIYRDANCTIAACYQQTQDHVRRVKEASQNITKNLLKKIEKHTADVDLEVTVLKQKINLQGETLLDRNQEASQKCAELSDLFYKKVDPLNSQEDFFAEQSIFMKKAAQQTEGQKKLALEVINYYDSALSMEAGRGELLREVLMGYLEIMKELQQPGVSAELLEQLIKAQQTKLIGEYYSVQEILVVKVRSEIKKIMAKEESEELTLVDLKAYLRSLSINKFNSKLLVLKEFKAYFKSQEDSFVVANAIVTVDGFMHLYQGDVKDITATLLEPDFSFKLNSSIKVLSQSESEVQISSIHSGQSLLNMLWKRRNNSSGNGFVFSLFFLSADHKIQFLDFVQNLLYS